MQNFKQPPYFYMFFIVSLKIYKHLLWNKKSIIGCVCKGMRNFKVKFHCFIVKTFSPVNNVTLFFYLFLFGYYFSSFYFSLFNSGEILLSFLPFSFYYCLCFNKFNKKTAATTTKRIIFSFNNNNAWPKLIFMVESV